VPDVGGEKEEFEGKHELGGSREEGLGPGLAALYRLSLRGRGERK